MLATIAMLAEPYRRERFFTFLDPWSDPDGAGFQSVQAQIALGSGGLHGVGLGDGVQKAFYLPEAHTDMILATVGEELGLIGVVAVLAAFGLFAVAGLRIALGARDLHQQVLAAGLTTFVVMQAVDQHRRRPGRPARHRRAAALRLVRGQQPHHPPGLHGDPCQHRTPITRPTPDARRRRRPCG